MELNKVLEGFTVNNTLCIKAQVQVIRYFVLCHFLFYFQDSKCMLAVQRHRKESTSGVW